MIIHNQQAWKPIFEAGTNEQCHSLSWFKPNEKVFAASITQHTTRSIKVYDSRGSFSSSCSFY
jgi:hypothetical protein